MPDAKMEDMMGLVVMLSIHSDAIKILYYSSFFMWLLNTLLYYDGG